MVDDRGDRDRCGVLGDRLGGGDAAPAAGDDQPQLRFHLAGLRQQRPDLGFERRAVERQLDRLGRALQPLVMLGEGEGAAGVEPDHLEDAVAAVEPVVLERQRGLGGRGDRAVDASQLGEFRIHAARLSEPARGNVARPILGSCCSYWGRWECWR